MSNSNLQRKFSGTRYVFVKYGTLFAKYGTLFAKHGTLCQIWYSFPIMVLFAKARETGNALAMWSGSDFAMFQHRFSLDYTIDSQDAVTTTSKLHSLTKDTHS